MSPYIGAPCPKCGSHFDANKEGAFHVALCDGPPEAAYWPKTELDTYWDAQVRENLRQSADADALEFPKP